jgi:hypothetical protein
MLRHESVLGTNSDYASILPSSCIKVDRIPLTPDGHTWSWSLKDYCINVTPEHHCWWGSTPRFKSPPELTPLTGAILTHPSPTGSLWRHQSQQSCNTLTPFLFSFFYSLHVSVPTGHLQVRYTIRYFFKDYLIVYLTWRWPVGAETCSEWRKIKTSWRIETYWFLMTPSIATNFQYVNSL